MQENYQEMIKELLMITAFDYFDPDFKKAKEILEENVNIDINQIKNEQGETLLHFVAYIGDLEFVQYLAETKGADVNTKASEGWTPLAIASLNKKLLVCQFLVD
jgi:ankyrin repeat protein